ncbi:12295_t:CDS:2 [Funneliformis caledonium]|uniref:12295_t:CDS:1 n=1 Tax=Funneliformis caledonium TaxID=1117310 RepID=A0A9N9H6W2_9GLOM|nr:12295_t:CDS:2 [Funneliformis caledonium]
MRKQSEKPSLKNFLDYRLHEVDLEQEETEHNRYVAVKEFSGKKIGGYTATNYSAGCVLVVGKAACLLVSSIVNSILYCHQIPCWLRACWLVYSLSELPYGLRAHKGKDDHLIQSL